MAGYGAVAGVPGFVAVIAAAPISSPLLFAAGTFLIGFGAGLFGHGTLTATMQLAPKNQVGLALGAWGAVQATAAGVAVALGGVLRDIIVKVFATNPLGPALGYISVYAIEIVLLIATLVAMVPLIRRTSFAPQQDSALS
jgi:BCD family chlorophyll transporter-like MFS transporter